MALVASLLVWLGEEEVSVLGRIRSDGHVVLQQKFFFLSQQGQLYSSSLYGFFNQIGVDSQTTLSAE